MAGVAVLALVPRVVPADSPRDLAGGSGGALGFVPSGKHSRRLDLAGLGIAVPAVFLVVLPLMLGHQENWPSWVFACVAAGLALCAVFVLTERRIADRGGDPLLNLAVLRAPGLVPGLAAVAVLMITYGGFLFSFALHLQAGLGSARWSRTPWSRCRGTRRRTRAGCSPRRSSSVRRWGWRRSAACSSRWTRTVVPRFPRCRGTRWR
ncbi:MAG TPA: hypothetical protein VIY52_00490 [Streptosporangiaceae bacterium]